MPFNKNHCTKGECERQMLREALKPFAAIVDGWSKQHLAGHVTDDNEVYVSVKHLRAAHAALKD